MSLHSFPQRSASDAPVHEPDLPPGDDGLAARPGRLHDLASPMTCRTAEYGVPGLRPNANVLVGRPLDRRLRRRRPGHRAVGGRAATAAARPGRRPAAAQQRDCSRSTRSQLGRLGVRFVLIDRDPPDRRDGAGLGRPACRRRALRGVGEPGVGRRGDRVASAEAVDPAEAPDLLRERADELAGTALVDGSTTRSTCAAGRRACAPCRCASSARRRSTSWSPPTSPARASSRSTSSSTPAGASSVDGVPADVLEVDGLVVGVEVPPVATRSRGATARGGSPRPRPQRAGDRGHAWRSSSFPRSPAGGGDHPSGVRMVSPSPPRSATKTARSSAVSVDRTRGPPRWAVGWRRGCGVEP